MEALIPAMKSPPAMTITPIPKDPRGSLGEPPPPAPLCLIISRILDTVNKTYRGSDTCPWGYDQRTLCCPVEERGTKREREFEDPLTRKSQRAKINERLFCASHNFNLDQVNCSHLRKLTWRFKVAVFHHGWQAQLTRIVKIDQDATKETDQFKS